MKKINILLTICFVIGFVLPSLAQSQHFETSLHKTREGKPTWYDQENGGYETLTGAPIEDLGCVGCHDAVDANGDPYPPTGYEPDCVDCHATGSFTSTEGDCLGCHGRQGKLRALGWSDVHRDASTPMVCWDCHGTTDMHGDGSMPPYTSMLDDGAITTDCLDCHSTLVGNHSPYDMHNEVLHCSSCHQQTALSCYNCHFDSMIEEHVKRAKQPITGFVILVNREKDGKVHPATFQSLYHDSSGGSWVAMAPSYTHSITKNDARTCGDCHQNMGSGVPAIEDYNAGGGINFATWNSSDSTLTVTQGIVPLPVDYKHSFIMDFITYEGNLSDPPGASKNWTFVKSVTDGFQLDYCTPMTMRQMDILGMDTLLVGVEQIGNQVPSDFQLEQNYPNPFNPSTTIRYSITVRGDVELKVYDALGTVVETLVNREQEAGVYQVEFTPVNLASGVYFYQIKTNSFVETKKLVLLK
jgi:hypothetical protein